jgi:hypothetical protein
LGKRREAILVGFLGRLRTHDAELIASLGHKQGVVDRVRPYEPLGPTGARIDKHDIALKAHALRALDGQKPETATVKRDAVLIANQPGIMTAIDSHRAKTGYKRHDRVGSRWKNERDHCRCDPMGPDEPGKSSHRRTE